MYIYTITSYDIYIYLYATNIDDEITSTSITSLSSNHASSSNLSTRFFAITLLHSPALQTHSRASSSPPALGTALRGEDKGAVLDDPLMEGPAGE